MYTQSLRNAIAKFILSVRVDLPDLLNKGLTPTYVSKHKKSCAYVNFINYRFKEIYLHYSILQLYMIVSSGSNAFAINMLFFDRKDCMQCL